MNLNLNQVLAIVIGLASFLAISTTNLTDLFGPQLAKYIISCASLVSGGSAVVLGVLTGQVGMIKSVEAMPGVDRIVANKAADQMLATRAVDPTSKVEPAPGAEATLTQTATGTGATL